MVSTGLGPDRMYVYIYVLGGGHQDLKNWGGGWVGVKSTDQHGCQDQLNPLPVTDGFRYLWASQCFFWGLHVCIYCAKKTEVGRRSGFPTNLSSRLPKYTELEAEILLHYPLGFRAFPIFLSCLNSRDRLRWRQQRASTVVDK